MILMPTYRKLHTKIIDSFDFAEMPDDFTRVFWLLLIVATDSEGRMIDSPAWLRSKMFPMRSDVNGKQIESALSWLAERGMVVRYQYDGRGYFYVKRFKDYQSGTEKEAKSTLPAPPEQLQTHSVPTPDQLQSDSVPAQELPRPSVYVSASVNESVNASESESAGLVEVRNLLETVVGIPFTPGDIETIEECETLGVTEDDIRGALKWRMDHSVRPVKTLSGLLEGIRTSRNIRVQRESANMANDPERKTDYMNDAYAGAYNQGTDPEVIRKKSAEQIKMGTVWKLWLMEVSAHVKNQIEGVRPLEYADGLLVLSVPSETIMQFVDGNLRSSLERQFMAKIEYEIQERKTA